MLRKEYRLIWIVLCGLLIIGFPVAAVNPVKNSLEWMEQLETEVMGGASEGAIVERLNRLEEIVVGRIRNESLVKRLTYLDKLLYVNQPHDICLVYKIQALEWVVFRRTFPGALQQRIERIEQTLFNQRYHGPCNQRLERLIIQVFPDGVVTGSWVTLPEGWLVKVKITQELSSTSNVAGDSFQYEVVDTVSKSGRVIFAKGMTGTGILQRVNRPGKLGNDARLVLDFKEIRALDGTPVQLHYGKTAGENNRSRQLMVGASAAGMLIFGPEGILIGLAVKGREKVISVETEFYLQIKEPVRVFTILE